MLVSPTLVRMEVPVLFKETVVTRALVLLDIAETTVKLQQNETFARRQCATTSLEIFQVS